MQISTFPPSVSSRRFLQAGVRCDQVQDPPSPVKDWGVDKLYNTLCGFQEDGCAELLGHIKTCQAKYLAEVFSNWFVIWK
jgi:hypothetical protein